MKESWQVIRKQLLNLCLASQNHTPEETTRSAAVKQSNNNSSSTSFEKRRAGASDLKAASFKQNTKIQTKRNKTKQKTDDQDGIHHQKVRKNKEKDIPSHK